MVVVDLVVVEQLLMEDLVVVVLVDILIVNGMHLHQVVVVDIQEEMVEIHFKILIGH